MIPDTPSIEQLSELLADRNPSHEPPVPTDALFSILSHRHRRYALAYLLERNEPVPVEALVSHVANRIDTSGPVYNQVALRFHHGHFPKLIDAGLIEYDKERLLIAPTNATATAKPHLELASA